MRKLLVAFSLSSLVALPALALAKGGTPQNHHCMKDGAELAGKTKKECKKEGGKWDKTSDATPTPTPDAAKAEPTKGDPK